MKRFSVLFLILFILVLSAGSFDVYAASNLPDVEVSIYLDGYPVDGTIVGISSVNVYKEGSFDNAIDTLEPGTVITLKAQYAYADGTNYFYINYIKDNVEHTGLVEFYSVDPIGVVITPEGVVGIEDFDKNLYETFKDFIEGLKTFFTGLRNILNNIFPFFTNAEIALVVSFIVIFLSLLVYLFFRKVTV